MYTYIYIIYIYTYIYIYIYMDLEHTNSLNKHSMLEILPLQSRAVADKNNVPRLRVHSACSLDTTHQKTRA